MQKCLKGLKAGCVFWPSDQSFSGRKMNMPLSSMVYFLRDAVDAGVLTDRNGFMIFRVPARCSRFVANAAVKVRLMMFSGAASENPCRGLRGMIFRRWRGNLLRAF